MIRKLIDKLFLSKEIHLENGVIQFKRYRLLSTPWFGIYIHRIYKSDPDPDPHNHPWNFFSLVLYGSYQETDKDGMLMPLRRFGSFYKLNTDDYHKIYHGDPATVLVFAGKRCSDCWGYWTKKGFVDWETYRQIHDGKSEVGKT
jgi:hypothetical protein